MKPSKLRSLVYRWLPLLLWMAAIFVVSGQASTSVPQFGAWDIFIKKAGHFAAYALFYVLALRATRNPWAAFALSFVYAVSDELHQTTVVGRNGRFTDVLIDSAGALTMLLTRSYWLGTRLGRAVVGSHVG